MSSSEVTNTSKPEVKTTTKQKKTPKTTKNKKGCDDKFGEINFKFEVLKKQEEAKSVM